MKNYEIKISKLKKEFTEAEAEALAVAFAIGGGNLGEVVPLDCVIITHGAEPLAKWKTKNTTKRTKTAEALGDLFGLPYVSNSVEGEAAALWNTNTSAHLAGLDGFKFLGLAIAESGEGVGLFQEHNTNGEEVGGVRCLVLSSLLDFVAEQSQKQHEAERVQKLEKLNSFRATVRQMLPKVCQILDKYRGKRWGEQTKDKIRAELKETHSEGVSVSFSVSGCWLDVQFVRGFAYAHGLGGFSWKWDNENNTPAEEIKPTAQQLEGLANIEIKEHRQKIKALIQEMEKTAQKLGALIDEYNSEARGKGYQKAESLSRWGVDLENLTSRELDR